MRQKKCFLLLEYAGITGEPTLQVAVSSNGTQFFSLVPARPISVYIRTGYA